MIASSSSTISTVPISFTFRPRLAPTDPSGSRETEHHRGAAAGRVLDRELAPQGAGETPGHGEPQSHTVGTGTCPVSEPLERLEHGLPLRERDAGSLVD